MNSCNTIFEIKAKKKMTSNQYDELKVALEIEKFVEGGKLTYLEAICHFCEIHDIEMEEAPKYIHKNIMDKLKIEASELRLLDKTEEVSKLPF